MTKIQHIPVLLEEVLTYLQPEPNQVFIDGTVGQGGHASAIADRILPGGRLLAIDRDPVNLKIARERLETYGDRIVYVNDSYANVTELADEHNFHSVNGILLDLGYSSLHIEDASRGFSFMKEGPLDMRYDPEAEVTAAEIVNEWSEESLAKIFRIYGEEVRAAQIARVIIDTRRHTALETTIDLANLVTTVVHAYGPIHPATKVFQALRIAVNDELGELERALPQCVDTLAIGGRLGIITFHSLEDRIVKNFFKSYPNLEVVIKRPVAPSREEIKANPRSRSAKLRVAIKT
ncbi:MAG: 16S rRNA (cytosine(1402)-N(4))-methyltransferase RsmH [Candidatus Uhrbacteria bacterium]|nr:16S rRNA (cytosine(1402)-N(4))-methyltransferase RsmH [Candidatus Uhrbacteria bacterium]